MTAAFYALKAVGTRARSAAWLARTRGRLDVAGLRILFYHRIADDRDELAVSPVSFRRQMAYLAGESYRVVDVVEAVDLLERGALRPRTIGLSFDDGYLDVAEHAPPTLAGHGFRATVFVAPGVIDGSAWFDWYKTPAAPRLGRHRGARSGRDASLRGSLTTHPNLLTLEDHVARHEIAGSKEELERRLGRAVEAFSYPSGLFGERDRRLVAGAGYRIAVSCEPGVNGLEPTASHCGGARLTPATASSTSARSSAAATIQRCPFVPLIAAGAMA